MARPKYKLNTRIEYSIPGGTEMDTVTGVISREDGYHYEVSNTDHDGIVKESDVLAAYRKIEGRKTAAKSKATKKKPETKSRTVTQESQAFAQ